MNARQAAYHILKSVFDEHRLVTDFHGRFLSAVRDERDRRLAVEIVYGVCRYRGRLDYVLARYADQKKTHPDIWLLLQCGAYQLLFLTRTPDYAVINETVSLARQYRGQRATGFVNAVLKRIAQEREQVTFPGPDNLKAFITANLSFPYWLGMKWISQYGHETGIRIMKNLNIRRPLVFRKFGASVPMEQDLVFHPAPHLENAVEANAPIYLMRAGNYYVMNEASQLIAELLLQAPGDWALDAAASPGGKGLILASEGQVKQVVFNDIAPNRINRVLENSRDLQIPILTPVCSDMTRPPFRPGMFDVVLLDAPCTGTGTLAGHPELKWLRKPGDLHGRTVLQRNLLAACYTLLKPGGVLLYSVCSLEKEEGESIVLDFLADTGDARLEDPFQYADPKIRERFAGFLTASDMLRVLPDRHLDGFFAALIRKSP